MPDYKCRNNVELGCGDTCCKFCLGASECKYACQGRPDECGLSENKIGDGEDGEEENR